MKASQIASLVVLALMPCACDGGSVEADAVEPSPKTSPEPESEPTPEPAAEEPTPGPEGTEPAEDEALAAGDGDPEIEAKISADQAPAPVGPDGKPLKIQMGGRVPPPP